MSTSPVPTPDSGPLIRLSSGTGTGPTRLAAFDAALGAAGLADYNLLPLSSVIPTGTRVVVVDAADQVSGEHGDILYCVYATAAALQPGAEGWAGVAWALRDDGSGAGLFVEHHADTEAALHASLGATLSAMITRRPDRYTETGRLVARATCTGEPGVAVVVATYRTVGWSEQPSPAPGPAGLK